MRRRAALFSLLALLGLAVSVPSASAEVPIRVFGMVPSTTQAGGHPDLQVAFAVKNSGKQQLEDGLNSPCDCENPRFITVHAPKGLVGNPHATPQCTASQFASTDCPVDSQVGVVEIGLASSPMVGISLSTPVYNLVPRAGEAGLLAFKAQGFQIFESFGARTAGDYGLETKVAVPDLLPLNYTNQILWGVPAHPSNDDWRFKPGSNAINGTGINVRLCDENGVESTPNGGAEAVPPSGPGFAVQVCVPFDSLGVESNSPEEPFIQSPTSCGTPLEASMDILAYDGTSTFASAPYPEATGCDQLTFNPSLAARSDTKAADSPSGLDVELTVPQFQSPTVPSPSTIRGTEMLLPEGFSINSAAADGKSACSDAQGAFGTENEAKCPETSKIGTLEIETALLPGPLPGFLYLGQPLPGNRYRVFLTADGFNVHVKLAGRAELDPNTGRIRVIFEDLPETPFQKFSLHIFGAEKGALATPTRCGTYEINTTFTPWADVLGKQSSKTSFEITEGPNGTPCPTGQRPFNLGLEAGSAQNQAGAHSPFALRLTREDGNQFLSALNVKTPPGFAATLKGVPYCPEATIAAIQSSAYSGISELNNPSCPAASQVGEVIGGAGAGSRPFHAPGRAYLAGPYKGAPLSLATVVPAVSGPYDLGNIMVRNALHVDPGTAQVSAISDPLPQIIEGVPLRVRSVLVSLNKPNFTLNPTNCDPHAVTTKISGDEGATATPQAHFQVANCANLPFAPRLSIRLKGGTKRTGHPALTGTLRPRPGDANIASLTVALPRAEFLDQSHIQTVCTRVQFAADNCPAASIYGHASATTPLLDVPLGGPVYLRSSSNPLPDLVVALKGPPSLPIEIEAAGRVDTSPQGGIRTSFDFVPDAQVTSFTLSMQGGNKGLLENSTNICKSPQRATVKAIGQNGKRATLRPKIQADCKGKAKKRAKRKARKSQLRARVAAK